MPYDMHSSGDLGQPPQRATTARWFILLNKPMNEEIPNLTAFDEAGLDAAFARLERQARAAATLDGEAGGGGLCLGGVGGKAGGGAGGDAGWRGGGGGLSSGVPGTQAGAAERSLRPVAEGCSGAGQEAAGGALQRAEGGGGGVAGRGTGSWPDGCGVEGRGNRHYAAGDAAADGGGASDYADAERDCGGVCGAGLLGGRGAGGGDRLLQL